MDGGGTGRGVEASLECRVRHANMLHDCIVRHTERQTSMPMTRMPQRNIKKTYKDAHPEAEGKKTRSSTPSRPARANINELSARTPSGSQGWAQGPAPLMLLRAMPSPSLLPSAVSFWHTWQDK